MRIGPPCAILVLTAALCHAQEPRYVPVGLFIGAIEEGARIFTPIRLLPFEHPEAQGHQFPNALVLHRSELEVLVQLGERVGLHLTATLERYPRPAVEEWAYEDFTPPPAAAMAGAPTVTPAEGPPLPGLRVAAFLGDTLIAFIVDTRGLSLDKRGMRRPTSMGLDLSRAEFLDALRSVGQRYGREGLVIVSYGSGGERLR